MSTESRSLATDTEPDKSYPASGSRPRRVSHHFKGDAFSIAEVPQCFRSCRSTKLAILGSQIWVVSSEKASGDKDDEPQSGVVEASSKASSQTFPMQRTVSTIEYAQLKHHAFTSILSAVSCTKGSVPSACNRDTILPPSGSSVHATVSN